MRLNTTLALALGVCTLASTAHAQVRRDGDGVTLKILRNEIIFLENATYQRRHLQEEDIARAIRLVREAQDSLLGKELLEVCSEDRDIDALRRATDTIKEVADNYLSMGSYDATVYAKAWVKEYPCSAAESFANTVVKLQTTADNEFSMGSYDASVFAKTYALKVCDRYEANEIAENAPKLREYADNSLSMGSYDASIWAKNKILKDYLQCENGEGFKYGRGRGDGHRDRRDRR
ncbi:hypothetical protein GW916_10315 [bacterium]|nr:hypothetical protein [bacterium]